MANIKEKCISIVQKNWTYQYKNFGVSHNVEGTDWSLIRSGDITETFNFKERLEQQYFGGFVADSLGVQEGGTKEIYKFNWPKFNLNLEKAVVETRENLLYVRPRTDDGKPVTNENGFEKTYVIDLNKVDEFQFMDERYIAYENSNQKMDVVAEYDMKIENDNPYSYDIASEYAISVYTQNSKFEGMKERAFDNRVTVIKKHDQYAENGQTITHKVDGIVKFKKGPYERYIDQYGNQGSEIHYPPLALPDEVKDNLPAMFVADRNSWGVCDRWNADNKYETVDIFGKPFVDKEWEVARSDSMQYAVYRYFMVNPPQGEITPAMKEAGGVVYKYYSDPDFTISKIDNKYFEDERFYDVIVRLQKARAAEYLYNKAQTKGVKDEFAFERLVKNVMDKETVKLKERRAMAIAAKYRRGENVSEEDLKLLENKETLKDWNKNNEEIVEGLIDKSGINPYGVTDVL